LGDLAKEEEAVEGMQGEEAEADGETEFDEHIWLSLKNASVLTAHIAEKLGEKDAANKSAYEKNAEDYTAALHKLDSRYAEAVRAAKHDTLIFADRFPFRYMTSDYNLKYYAAFSGCSAESEASFKTLVFLADKLKELQLYKLMILDGSDGKIARAVIDTAGVADVKILTLNSMQSEIGENDSYLGIMENNLTVLQQALN
ncbi:MAG: zinc ABC transporter substrate-binding protein, partial [Ruminococcus sp.]|nr:zinc ABC transporter substrate-binding protein [Ruminococcus sp.]